MAEEEKKCYDKLNIPKHDTLIVVGDFNAKIRNYLSSVAGKQTIHDDKNNDNGMSTQK